MSLFVKYPLRITFIFTVFMVQGCASYKSVEAKITDFIENIQSNARDKEIAETNNNDLLESVLINPLDAPTASQEAFAISDYTIEDALEFDSEDDNLDDTFASSDDELLTDTQDDYFTNIDDEEIVLASASSVDTFEDGNVEGTNETFDDVSYSEILVNDAKSDATSNEQIASEGEAIETVPSTSLPNDEARVKEPEEIIPNVKPASESLKPNPPIISSPAHSKQASLSPKIYVEPYVLPAIDENTEASFLSNSLLKPALLPKTASHETQSESDALLGISSHGAINTDNGYIDILGTTNTIDDEDAIETQQAAQIQVQYADDDQNSAEIYGESVEVYDNVYDETDDSNPPSSLSVKDVMAQSIEKPLRMPDPIPNPSIPEFMKVMAYSDDLISSDGFMIFQTKKGKLKDNIIRLLSHTDADTNIIWNVSEQHTIFNDYWIKGKNVVDILDKILISYNDPHPINAELWLNRVVKIHYDKKNRRVR